MSTATVALGSRRRPRSGPGPDLHGFRMPLLPLAVSAGAHAAVVGALIVGAIVWKAAPTRTYVVNLVPAIPAVGVPQAQPAPPVPKPQTQEPPRVTRPEPDLPSRPRDLPTRETPTRDPKPVPLPTPPPREMPARDLPTRDMPLPDRPLPQRAPAATRAGDKELPSVPRYEPQRTVQMPSPPVATTATQQAALREPAPTPLGRPTGSPQGSGALTINSQGDFPFTWYLQLVQGKVHSRWAAPHNSQEGQIAVIVFEIMPDGRLAKASVEKTSGNVSYDLAALRAVTEASPFPQLPPEFKEPPLRIHLGIQYSKRG